MTRDQHRRYHVQVRAIMRAVRHVARGSSPEPVLRVAPAASRLWVRSHPALFMDLVKSERRESGQGA